jgi:hypothetical protein
MPEEPQPREAQEKTAEGIAFSSNAGCEELIASMWQSRR